jgi:hypothetical protein
MDECGGRPMMTLLVFGGLAVALMLWGGGSEYEEIDDDDDMGSTLTKPPVRTRRPVTTRAGIKAKATSTRPTAANRRNNK